MIKDDQQPPDTVQKTRLPCYPDLTPYSWHQIKTKPSWIERGKYNPEMQPYPPTIYQLVNTFRNHGTKYLNYLFILRFYIRIFYIGALKAE